MSDCSHCSHCRTAGLTGLNTKHYSHSYSYGYSAETEIAGGERREEN